MVYAASRVQPARERLEVAQIFRDHAAGFARDRDLPHAARTVLADLSRCRTAALGGHVEVCADCGHVTVAYNSCRNRHCPTCQPGRQRRWIEERQARVLPVHHFHVVFTLPAVLRPLAALNGRAVYEALMDAASATLLQLGEQRLGGQVGLTAVLHTWTRDLRLHPHVHCVVTGGALTRGEAPTWVASRKGFLFPVAVMRDLFRGKVLDRLQRLVRAGRLRLPADLDAWDRLRDDLYHRPWVVYAKRPFGGARQVFAYLGRYTHRVAISSARLRAYDGQSVTFRTRGDQAVTLHAHEFLRRFLLHLLPHGFRKIRHYGLLAPGSVNGRLAVARGLLEPRCVPVPTAPRADGLLADPSSDEAVPHCPVCGGISVIWFPLLAFSGPPSMDSS